MARGDAVVNWLALACSADGNTLIGSGDDGGLHLSGDAGITWTAIGLPGISWSVCSSADGARLLAGARGAVYSSTNLGATWRRYTVAGLVTNDLVSGLASSADGQTIIAVTQNGDSDVTGSMYISNDGGASWRSGTLTNRDSLSFWRGVSCSADASVILAVGPYSGAFLSTNDGSTWTHTAMTMATSAACSADGRCLVVGDDGGIIHISNNFGATWSEAKPAGSGVAWWVVASSADGHRLYAAPSSGQIWTIQTRPGPLLSVGTSGGSLLLSWVVPSMDFMLQECSDLSAQDWTEVLKPAALNYTNLHYEVAVPLSQGNRFFRLISR